MHSIVNHIRLHLFCRAAAACQVSALYLACKHQLVPVCLHRCEPKKLHVACTLSQYQQLSAASGGSANLCCSTLQFSALADNKGGIACIKPTDCPWQCLQADNHTGSSSGCHPLQSWAPDMQTVNKAVMQTCSCDSKATAATF